MDYLQTTGDRLHDLELDRILARLAVLESRGAAGVSNSTMPVSPSSGLPPTGVRSITPTGGTPMQDDLALTVVGPASLAQSGQTLTLTVSVSPATTVTEIGSAGVVGAAATFAREDHVHRGVHKITGNAVAVGDIVFAGAGVAQSGNTFTFSGSGGAAVVPSNVLVISPGSGAISWAAPNALTEFNNSFFYRAQHDLTNATQVRIVAAFPNTLSLVTPSLVAQYFNTGSSSWVSLDGLSGPNVTYAAGTQASSWLTLATAAKADVLLRIAAYGGDGATSVPFGSLYVQVK